MLVLIVLMVAVVPSVLAADTTLWRLRRMAEFSQRRYRGFTEVLELLAKNVVPGQGFNRTEVSPLTETNSTGSSQRSTARSRSGKCSSTP